MQFLHDLDTKVLIDMLSEQTNKYIGMLHAASVDENEFYRCRLLIKELQKEIESRKEGGKAPHSKIENSSFPDS